MMLVMHSTAEPRRVVLAVFDRLQALDLVGPLEVFSAATRLYGHAYSTEVRTATGDPIATSSGLQLIPDGDTSGTPKRQKKS